MTPENMENHKNNHPKQVHPDPYLNPSSNGNGKAKRENGASVDVTDEKNRPDWLPTGWRFKEFLRTSGASSGTKDKYFIDPVTSRRFRSKKEVFRYLESGETPNQKRKSEADANNAGNSELAKRKKSEAKPQVPINNFNFDNVPETVQWVMTDVYGGKWGPKVNGVDNVPEYTKLEWRAAFKYLTLQNGGKSVFR